jgi:hypothetical protein
MGLLTDGLIVNVKTFMSQSIVQTDNATGQKVYEDNFVVSFAAQLTEKGREFIEAWKSNDESFGGV